MAAMPTTNLSAYSPDKPPTWSNLQTSSNTTAPSPTMFFSCRPRQPPPPPPPRPQCLYTHCTRKALKCESKTKGKGLLSLYCKDHACRQRLGELMCPSPKGAGMSKYCDDHRRCQSQGCPNSRICADTSQDWPYCSRHTCYLEGCHQKRAPNDARTCVLHTPLCLIPGCDVPRSEEGLYCPGHSCAEAGCEAVISAGGWCAAHRVCKTAGCGKPRAVTAAGRGEEVCWQHLPTQCLAKDCLALTTERFCAQHKCTYPPCPFQRDDARDASRLYCAGHTCRQTPCPHPIRDPAGTEARYCVSHACASSPKCPHPAEPDGKHCGLHACLHPSCRSPRAADPLVVSGVQFCASHECRAPGCRDLAQGEGGGYCEALHACGVPGCASPRGTDGSVCCAASHAAVMAAGFGEKGGPRQTVYLSRAEEALGRRLREERERQEGEARLEREMRAWQAAARGGRRGREGSCDSGFGGSQAVSDVSNVTFVS